MSSEKFIWDGLALIKRNDVSYTVEPHVNGGNAILADDKVLFNDMLGTTLGSVDAGKLSSIERDAFGAPLPRHHGATALRQNYFFTGKPQVAGLGNVFLFRDYRPELGKWQTSDPLGYPDGWNNLAYCNNRTINSFDFLGGVTFTEGTFTNRRTPRPSYVGSRTPGAEEYLLLLDARASIATLLIYQPLARSMATHYLDGGDADYTISPGNIYDIFSSQFSTFETDATSYLTGLGNFQRGTSINFVSSGSVDGIWSSYQASQTLDLYLSLNYIYYCLSGSATKNSDGSIDVSININLHDFYDFGTSLAPAGIGLTDFDWYWLAVNGLAVPYNVYGTYTIKFTIPE